MPIFPVSKYETSISFCYRKALLKKVFSSDSDRCDQIPVGLSAVTVSGWSLYKSDDSGDIIRSSAP